MPKINKIKLSGATYDIQDSNASKTVTLTQAQYDALQEKDPNTFYIISDGETFDPSEKVDTSAFTAYSASVETALSGKVDTSTYNTYTAATDAALASKQTTLTAGTGISIIDNVISAEGGGSITVDQTIDRTSENPISNKAISNKATDGNGDVFSTSGRYYWGFYSVGGVSTNKKIWLDKINGEPVIKKYDNTRDLSFVETSAITTSVTSSSTDAQVPSAKAVYDALGGGGGITSGEVQSMIDESISGKTDESAFTAHTADTTIHVTSSDKTTWSGKQDALVSGTNIKTINNESILGSGNITIQGGGGSSVVELTQAQYDALTTIDPDTIYVITDAAGGDLSNYYTKAQINAMIGNIESLLAAI